MYDKQSKQGEAPLSQDPVFTVAEIKQQLADLHKVSICVCVCALCYMMCQKCRSAVSTRLSDASLRIDCAAWYRP
jgi:hypothetical protein